MPALGISLILIAVGAVLTIAVATAPFTTIGVILMCVGGLGLLMAMLFMMSFSPFGTHDDVGHTHV
jgi:hypothetical protein